MVVCFWSVYWRNYKHQYFSVCHTACFHLLSNVFERQFLLIFSIFLIFYFLLLLFFYCVKKHTYRCTIKQTECLYNLLFHCPSRNTNIKSPLSMWHMQTAWLFVTYNKEETRLTIVIEKQNTKRCDTITTKKEKTTTTKMQFYWNE